MSSKKSSPTVPDDKSGSVSTGEKKTSDDKKEPSTTDETKEEPSSTINLSISSKHTLWLIWFLLVYFTLYALVTVLMPSAKSGVDQMISGTVDTVFGALIVLVVGCGAYVLNADDKRALGRGIADFAQAPTSVIPVSLFLFIFYTCTHILRIPTGEHKPFIVGSLENVGWLMFVVTFSQFISHYLFEIDLIQAIKKFVRLVLYGKEKEPAPSPPVDSGPQWNGNEVFNVSDNVYTYQDAEAVCSALGARLATYEEIEETYKKGGEWCNYGWSANQLALFPTQLKTWQKLQSSDEEKDNCGRPGINGGKMNPEIKFGANCFGKRPKKPASFHKQVGCAPADTDAKPLTPHELKVASRAAFYKAHPKEISEINGHNASNWSIY